MNARYARSPIVNAVALAAGSILGLVIAMTLTFAFISPQSDSSTGTAVADATVYG